MWVLFDFDKDAIAIFSDFELMWNWVKAYLEDSYLEDGDEVGHFLNTSLRYGKDVAIEEVGFTCEKIVVDPEW